jgi:hypothetical protein
MRVDGKGVNLAACRDVEILKTDDFKQSTPRISMRYQLKFVKRGLPFHGSYMFFS